jgi:hypothetical protein
MHPHEEATVLAFIASSYRARWLTKLASAKHRGSFLDRLNHCPDFDERYASPLPSKADVVTLLKARGAPDSCHVTSDIASIDGHEMSLAEAVERAELGGFGTLVSCIPGRLGYYYDESGTRRLLLERSDI